MLARSLSAILLLTIAAPVAAKPVARPVAKLAFAAARAPIIYSLLPGRAPTVRAHQIFRRMDEAAPRFSLALTAQPDVRDRFEPRALPLSKARGVGMMSAGLQLKLVGDAGGFEPSVSVAGVVPGMMRYALR